MDFHGRSDFSDNQFWMGFGLAIVELDDPEPEPYRPSPAVAEATRKLIDSIINARVPEENFYRDSEE